MYLWNNWPSKAACIRRVPAVCQLCSIINTDFPSSVSGFPVETTDPTVLWYSIWVASAMSGTLVTFK